MKVYTKTGDNGTTGLSGGYRVDKDALRIQAIGDTDELNAVLGICRSLSKDSAFEFRIAAIQNGLFDLGSELSCPDGGRIRHERLGQGDIDTLETSIDQMTEDLAPLRHFVLPGGSALAANLHLARTVCRRAERSIVALSKLESVREIAIAYLNRLSDWLFVAARTANKLEGVEDIKWNSED